ncbi:dienelactone hydrolase [Pseudomonas sp. MF6751]|uniref:alpha/beta hydrolase family protein n=1 Tax=Pseudomonas TaxID=286 RepID=UPI00190A8E77|nr:MULTISPECIES: dienelactone hydrolase [Pseudomonas]MBK3479777.1 dienelactone hydrolase [Pseudomonas sp. MF6751]MBY8952227.1 dienelactone hydrolase [Pseudomonas carnis]MCF5691645.1 dienelactone hydrolase [Pseudomonas sp. PA-1-8C]MCF5789418.1 dienelactone hydrolase [Pseudomonas sp. PA-1-6G]MCF5793771.1 dienelactone hydrolase [Pseudomonas sp. PA-1-6B]
MMRLCAVLVLSLLGGLVSVHAAPAPHPHWSVGFHRMSVLDPLDSQPMKAIAFYPSTDTERTTPLGAYQVAASEDAKVAIGRFPVLMLSHGNTGTPLALHDLATSLVRKGFVVVAVLHPGDNYKDHSRLGTVSNLYGRPIQISQAITATLADPMLSPFVDVDQIGVIGYSAGGETALILAGAKPDFERLRRYCQERPEDRDACTTKGELVVDRDDLQPQADPRIHALMLMAPLSLMFGRHTLADVHVPVLLYSGDGDQLVAVDKNAAALARKLPEPPDFKLLAGAGHFVFMAPCDSDQLATMPGICTDADGVDREGIHRDMVSEAGRFFSRTLGEATRAGLQTADQ